MRIYSIQMAAFVPTFESGTSTPEGYLSRVRVVPPIGMAEMTWVSPWRVVSISIHCPRSPHATPLPQVISQQHGKC